MPSKRSKKDPNEKERGTTSASKTEETPRSDTFDSWAIVEVMGHNTFAGRVTEQAIGGASFVRVDVPELPATSYDGPRPAFTKLVGAGSIYAITPCSEEVARKAAAATRLRPVTIVDIQRALPAGDDEAPY